MKQQDIPAPIAVAVLAVLLGVLCMLQYPAQSLAIYNALNTFVEKESTFLIIQSAVLMANILIGLMLLPAGLKNKNLRQQILQKSKWEWKSLKNVILFCAPLAILSFFFLPIAKVSDEVEFTTAIGLLKWVFCVARFNVAILVFLFSYIALKIKFKRQSVKLPALKHFENEIVLGAIDETSDSPNWLSVDLKSLNGNTLITGSIGSGKTQGTVLPYLKQLICNLNPSPAVLCIDPKGTFTKEAIKIAKASGHEDRIVHIKLGGSKTFNPIFVKDALRGARFLQTTQMLRAAAANFSRSKAGDFWELSSFNLLKNCLVHLAATKTYYTLNDLYQTVLDANTSKLSIDLIKEFQNFELDLEQKSNIASAQRYFEKEFSAFEEKLQTNIMATTTSFLNQFQEYQASRIFCPAEQDLTIKSMAEAIRDSKIILFDVTEPGLSKAMGTFVKLSFEQAVLDRLKNGESNRIPAVMIVDEYQDVVSVGNNGSLGDDKFLAKCREGNAIVVAATQSLSSIDNALGSEKAAKEIFQNFRTRIACHSADLSTIKSFQELVGEYDREKLTESYSRHSPDASLSAVTGNIDSRKTNMGESISLSTAKESYITAKDFSNLEVFEAFAIVFDGVRSQFQKLFLKPHFLAEKETTHRNIIELMRKKDRKVLKTAAAGVSVAVLSIFLPVNTKAAALFPNLCDVVKSPDFTSNLELNFSGCTCGWPPHPCAFITYYAPETFIEVVANPKESFFKKHPGASLQLKSLGPTSPTFGAEGELDSHSFHAHVLTVPFLSAFSSAMPCGSNVTERGCFEAMSEHLGPLWSTGSADLLQPQFLAFGLNPKACLLWGAAKSLVGGEPNFHPGGAMCSTPRQFMKIFPPSSHSACAGWGPFFPRSGTYEGPSQTVGSMMIAARMKSLASEVFLGTPTMPDEKWQMIKPNSSAGFREGETPAFVETFKRGNEYGRLAGGGVKNYLYVIWRRRACCKELTNVVTTKASVVGIKAACSAGGFF